jgi:hypothetical protein
LDTFDDLEDMAPLQLDAMTTERLIAGVVAIDDAPPGFGRVAELIHKAQGPATAEELRARAVTVTAFAAHARSRSVARTRTKRTFAFSKFPVKVLALAVPVVLLGGGVATATGSLPSSAQAAVSRALSTVGISVPKPQAVGAGIAGSLPSSTANAGARSTGAGARSRSTGGLCRAWRSGGLNDQSTAYRNLTAAAGGVGDVPTYCAGVAASSSNAGASSHQAETPSGELNRRQALRRSGAVAGGKKATSHTAQPKPSRGQDRVALGTSRLPVRSHGLDPVSTGLLSGRGTHTSSTGGHKSRTKAGKGKPPGSTSSTGTSGTSSPVESSPVLSSNPPSGGGSSKHHGTPGRHRRQRGCTSSAGPKHLIPVHHCQPVTSSGSTSNTPSLGSGGHKGRAKRPTPSVGSKPRSVKHRKSV